MLGALIGDIVGSPYEWKSYKSKNFPLFLRRSRMTDDSVLTAAVASALLMGGWREDLKLFQENLVKEFQRLGRAYVDVSYGPRFERWLLSDDPAPYQSFGNGSAMRVSPVAWVAETMEECLTLAEATAAVTHDHPDGIAGAKAIAGAVFLARTGGTKEEIKAHGEQYYPINFTLDEIRRDYKMDSSCAGSVPQAIEAFLEAEDFEDALRNAVSIGGDSDTIASMAGAIAGAFFGIPKEIRAEAKRYIDGEVGNIYDRFAQVF